MEQQLKDWIDFCEGNNDFDTSHFHTLFMEGEGKNGRRSTLELLAIFGSFPNAEELVRRVESVSYESAEVTNIQDHLLKYTELDLIEKKKILKELDEVDLINSINKGIQFVHSVEEVLNNRAEDELYNEFESEIDFYVTDNFAPDEKKMYALFEAFYGLVNDYQLSWYLGSPLIDSSINFDYYFEIWKNGGVYSISENNGVLVSRR